ncbi:MAG: sensor histidine kinase [Archangium sp.]|nr:sensor histidine kinase [Archangium sp.]
MTVASPLRGRAALSTVRSVLGALVLVALFGSLAALLSYRADVTEARRQVRERVAQQGRLYADSLGLHFDVIRAELQRLADRGFSSLSARDESVLAGIREDRTLFSEGVVLFDLQGRVVWSEPPTLKFPQPASQPWFTLLLGVERPTIDEFVGDDTSRLAVALPVRENGKLAGALVGLVGASDRLLYGVEGPGEQLMLLSSRERVLVPLTEPQWSHAPGFDAQVEVLRATGGDATWTLEGHEVMAEAFPVKNTSLQVLALESEETSVAPIRRRLNVQLAFLLVVQLVALGAFVVFLRRTWRTFLDAELRFAEQEKMAALGSAASLIAHEVKNSLNGLQAATSLLETGGEAALVTRTVKGQVERLGHLARSLLSFSKPSELRRVPVELDALTSETVQALSALPEWPEAKVSLELEPRVALDSDPLLLTTAIDNLVRNAIEAVVAAKDVGKVSVPTVVVRVKRDGTSARVEVEDNAGGAPAELEEKLGTPFFTTKPRGIGLGLAMTQRAVEQLGGTLRFERLASGTRFTLSLRSLR